MKISINNVTIGDTFTSLSFEVADNDRIVVTGKNGTGKTTLLRLLSGVYCPKCGAISYDNAEFTFPANLFTHLSLTKTVRNNIFYAEGSTILYNDYSIEQNMNYYMGVDSYMELNTSYIIDLLEIDEPKNKLIKELSLGTKQKIVAALSLLTKKTTIILDEPTLGIDSDVSKKYIETLLNQAKTVVISSHEKEFYPLFDKAYIVDFGRIELMQKEKNNE